MLDRIKSLLSVSQRQPPALQATLPRTDAHFGQPQVYNLDQLRQHALLVAKQHEIAYIKRGKSLLIMRLADNEKVLSQTYELLGQAVQTKQPISPAGEWLLDNFHLIEEQIRTARKHLPPGFNRELPHLANGKSKGLPRVYDIALEVIAHSDSRIDNENIAVFVDAYQQSRDLSLGELWAIPIMLRLALIENLRRVAARVMVAMEDRAQAAEWAAKAGRRINDCLKAISPLYFRIIDVVLLTN